MWPRLRRWRRSASLPTTSTPSRVWRAGAPPPRAPKRGPISFTGPPSDITPIITSRSKTSSSVGDLPRSTRNIDGGTVGGPIKKNKLFFFGGWEGMRERAEASGFYTVATADQREGNFSAYGTQHLRPSHRY